VHQQYANPTCAWLVPEELHFINVLRNVDNRNFQYVCGIHVMSNEMKWSTFFMRHPVVQTLKNLQPNLN